MSEVPSWIVEKVYSTLDDWKTAIEISIETGLRLDTVKRALKKLEQDKKIWRDGPLYINRYGRR